MYMYRESLARITCPLSSCVLVKRSQTIPEELVKPKPQMPDRAIRTIFICRSLVLRTCAVVSAYHSTGFMRPVRARNIQEQGG